MSCLMTSATRRSRSVPAAVLIASAAASSHEVLLVPMISVTLYTLMTISFDRGPAPSPCCQPSTEPVVDPRPPRGGGERRLQQIGKPLDQGRRGVEDRDLAGGERFRQGGGDLVRHGAAPRVDRVAARGGEAQ